MKSGCLAEEQNRMPLSGEENSLLLCLENKWSYCAQQNGDAVKLVTDVYHCRIMGRGWVCPKGTATAYYPKLDESGQHSPILFLKIHFNIILSSTHTSVCDIGCAHFTMNCPRKTGSQD
jgi:hypothetical protein